MGLRGSPAKSPVVLVAFFVENAVEVARDWQPCEGLEWLDSWVVIGWMWRLVEVNPCWAEVKRVVWNGCGRVSGCGSSRSSRRKENVIDGREKICGDVSCVAGGAYACPWCGVCDAGGGDGVGRALGDDVAFVVAVVAAVALAGWKVGQLLVWR